MWYTYQLVRQLGRGCPGEERAMRRAYVSAERVMDVPAAVVYHCIADYREHHRTEGFLPPVFTDLQVEQGGVGAGTVIRFTMNLGGRRRTAVARVEEPQP